jgi:hypothetical protein
MTLHATRSGQQITIHHSPSGQKATEDAEHVRQLHNQLGKLLEEAEHERPPHTHPHPHPHPPVEDKPDR